MKKWMIPVFAVGGVATVGAAVLGGVLLFGGNRGGMKTPEEVMGEVVQAQLIEGNFEQLCMLGRYPMIKAVCDPEVTDKQVLQCVDKAGEYWDESVQSAMETLGGIEGYTVVSLEQIPLDEDEIAYTVERYDGVGEQVDDVVDVECEMEVVYGEDGEAHTQYMDIRAIEIDDRWYFDILQSGIPDYLMGAYYELLETGQLDF